MRWTHGHCGGLFLAVKLLSACDDHDGADRDAGTPVNDGGRDVRADGAVRDNRSDDAGSDALERIAGTGNVTGGGENGWQAAFEAGPGRNAELSRPHFAMANDLGELFIADKDAHAIRKLDPRGIITTTAGMNEPGDDGDDPGPAIERHLSAPNGLFVTEDGTVFILDLGNEKVRRLSRQGELTTLFHAPGQMAVGRGLWVAPDATAVFYCAGTRLMRWSSEAGVVVIQEGFGSLGNIAMDGDNNLVVTDRGTGQVWRMRGEDAPELIVGAGQDPGTDGMPGQDVRLPGVRAVWPDGDGGLWLGTHESSRIWQLDHEGILHLRYRIPDVEEVRGLTVTPDGCLVVVYHDGGFIKRACPSP